VLASFPAIYEKEVNCDLSIEIFELEDKEGILPILYGDCVSHVEEISLIEEDYLWGNVTVYVNDLTSMQEFLLLHSPSFFWGGRSISAYMKAKDPLTIAKFGEVLKRGKDVRMHLQTSVGVEPYIRQFMKWLNKAYTVRYHRADAHTFRPNFQNKERAVLLTPENVKEYMPSASARFIKRLETAQVYGYVNEEGRMVATSGIGFLTRKSFSISYTETEPEYRGRGIAKCLTSLASEPLIRKGLIGVYAADTTNRPSIGVAEGLGFLRYKEMMCFYNRQLAS